ncbi:response regulator transcription factor [Dorea longicatena]|uniref:Stage 0 sporulation protein A homolog n=1 Tax=Dorea longicatena TaxID=88431 RepID=A0A3E5GCT8_9FIRM|nr:response regulator transcription factor [Dorea longicatena]RGO32110.1 DNA-binding response regulator [Dorea longicatena]
MYKILIVEDDETIAGGLKTHLEKWNYQTECMTDFKDVMGKFLEFEPQLVLLDIVLPFFNGFHWCQEIRKISKVPIIFLSSANDNMNIVMAMNMGGDEFIEKPFDLNVVTAKVQAVLRRTYEFRGTADIMEWNGAILNLADATVLYQDQKQELTKNEFKILQMLLENTGKIVSRESIMTRLWDSNEFIDDNTLTVNVARLRKKMEQIGLGGKIITKKGIGYMVEA